MAGARPRFSLLLLLVALFLGGCREQGDIKIHSLDFQGVKQVDKKALAAALQTKRGSRLPWGHKTYFDRRAFEADLERLQAFYRDRGFPDARVASFDVKLNDKQDQVDVVVKISEQGAGGSQVTVAFSATPGTLAHFGPVDIQGEKSVGENIVRRQLTYKPGDVFSRREMRESQRKLYGMELFQFASIESKEDKTQQLPEVPTLVTVAEGKHRRLTTGLGYGSEEKARATLRWDHLNFLGNARHAGVETKWSSLDRGVRLDYTEPYFLSG